METGVLIRGVSRTVTVWVVGLCAVLGAGPWGFHGWGVALGQVRNPHGVAVIVGNKNYPHQDVPNVDYADRDAKAFRRYVIDVLGFDPNKVVFVEDAKRREMFDVLGQRGVGMSDLWAHLDPGGRSDVVVYYSGHGVPGLREGKGYLLPVDVPPRSAEDEGYPLELLYEKLGQLREAKEGRRAKSVQVYLDACFSGSSYRGFLIQGASPVMIPARAPKGVTEGVTVLAAAGPKQIANWDEKAEHGLFTHHLLDSLYGKGDTDGDGKVTVEETKRYLDDHMTPAAWLSRRAVQRANLQVLGFASEAVLSEAPAGGYPERPVLEGSSDKVEVVKGDGGKDAVDKKAASPDSLPEGHGEVEEGLGLGYEDRVLVQLGLESKGKGVGGADGVFGRRTRAGLRSWQREKGLEETGYLTGEQVEALKAMGREAKERRERGRQAAASAEAERRREEAARKERERQAAAEAAARAAAEAEKRRRATEKRVGQVFRDCGECPDLVVVPGGSFEMGSRYGYENERPVHGVRVGEGLAVGVYEVTFDEWEACVKGGGCRGYRPDDEGWGRGNRPVTSVSWDDAQDYVGWLRGKTGAGYRLLSEAEWEYVARAGSRTAYYWGDSRGRNRANCNGCGSRWDYERTAPVGSFGANGFGLHDVHGNVREWVEDCWNDSYVGAPSDGSAWESGNCSRRVVRGGSWVNLPRYLRSAFRVGFTSGFRDRFGGFRVARTLTP